MLKLMREDAKTKGVSVPKNITAIRSTSRLFFVEADGVEGVTIEGECAADAKANYISALVDKHEATKAAIAKAEQDAQNVTRLAPTDAPPYEQAEAVVLDFTVRNEGTIFILTPNTTWATEWVNEHLPEDATRWANGYVIEHRYISEIVAGIQADGLTVGE